MDKVSASLISVNNYLRDFPVDTDKRITYSHPMNTKAQKLADGLQAAIVAAGTKSRLADGLGIKKQSIQNWSRIPAERALQIERLTGVSRTILRPDLYPDEAAP